MPPVDLLVFAEDPGAANFLAAILASIAPSGLSCQVFADGIAADYFAKNQISLSRNRSESADYLLEEFQPKLVLTGTAENKNSFAHELVVAARAAGIKSAAVVDAAMNASERFSGGSGDPLKFLPDYVFVTDDFTKTEFVNIGVPAEKVLVHGHPHFDSVLKHAEAFAGQAKQFREKYFPEAGRRPVLLFVSEGAKYLRARDPAYERRFSLRGSGNGAGRTEIVLEEVLFALKEVSPNPYLVLRLHPKDRLEYFSSYSSNFDKISVSENSLELVYAADIIIGSTSMLLTEAVLMQKPVLCIVPVPGEQNYLPSVRCGATVAAISREEVQREVKRICARPEEFIANKKFSPHDSTKKTIEALLKIVRDGEEK